MGWHMHSRGHSFQSGANLRSSKQLSFGALPGVSMGMYPSFLAIKCAWFVSAIHSDTQRCSRVSGRGRILDQSFAHHRTIHDTSTRCTYFVHCNLKCVVARQQSRGLHLKHQLRGAPVVHTASAFTCRGNRACPCRHIPLKHSHAFVM